MNDLTAEMTRFAELRPSEPTLTEHDLAELRRELFPSAAPPAAPPRDASVIELGDRGRPEPAGRRRVLGIAAAAVLVLGGAGIWTASDRDTDPQETAPASQPESSGPPAADAATESLLAVPRIAFAEPGWTLSRAYENQPDPRRGVLFLSGDELDGPWIEVTVVGGGVEAGGLEPTVFGGFEAQVSEFDDGALMYWTSPSGESLQAYGWQVDAATMAPILEAVAVTDQAVSFGSVPQGATLAGPDVTAAIGRYAEYGFVHEDGRELQVSFYAGGPRGQYSRIGGEDRDDVRVGEETGALVAYGDGRYRVNLERGFWAWELDGEPFDTQEAFLDTVAGITTVDEATWEGSLPAAIVGSDDRAAVIADLLNGVPLPDGFDTTRFEQIGTSDRYQFIAQVSGAVACAWLDRWFTGAETGDAAMQSEAAAALATSEDWPMLAEIDGQGGWSGAVWEWAEAVNGGQGIGSGNGPVTPSRELAESGLGCSW